jgi:hypothetical protein
MGPDKSQVYDWSSAVEWLPCAAIAIGRQAAYIGNAAVEWKALITNSRMNQHYWLRREAYVEVELEPLTLSSRRHVQARALPLRRRPR